MTITAKPDLEYTPLPDEETPSSSHLANLFFFSFDHSQGIIAIQYRIFEYIHNIRPNWQITEGINADILEIAAKRVERFLHHALKAPFEDTTRPIFHQSIGGIDVPKEIEGRLREMRQCLNQPGDEPPTKLHIIENITGAIIAGEFNLLYMKEILHGKKGRERQNADPHKTKADPYFSYICHYALNRRKTGIPEYDQMYTDIREFLFSDAEKSKDRMAELNKVVEIYNEKHPQTPVKSIPPYSLGTIL